MSITEEQLVRWAKAPSETEEGRCENTIRRISECIKNEFGDNVSVFRQGSYKNRTNVKQDSDVDLVVLHKTYYFPDLGNLSESDKQSYNLSHKDSDYTFAQFKNRIKEILEEEFDFGEVERKNKCIKIKKNSYRVDADVVPCFVHRRYRSLDSIEAEGIQFVTDWEGNRVYNFPEHHYQNGVSKNKNTDYRYKSVVRILKNVKNKLVSDGVITLDAMPSFFLESLIWNVSNDKFKKSNYLDATRSVIATIWNEMGEIEKADSYAEVNDLKWLFKGQSERTPEQARVFMQHAWDYIGYEN